MKVIVNHYGLKAKALARVVVFSDVHFRFRKHDYRTYGCQAQHEAMVKFARQMKPDAIILAGDNYNSLDELIGPGKLQRYLDCLAELASVAPVFYGIGNHEIACKLRLSPDKKQARYLRVLRTIAVVDNLTMLHNAVAEIKPGLKVAGLALPRKYYKHEFGDERKRAILRGMIRRHGDILASDKQETLVALIHSPQHLGPQELALMPDVDYVLCGHMHSGAVPTRLQRLWPGTRGVISPEKHLFPATARDGFRSYDDKVITLGAVGSFSLELEPLNLICMPQFTLIDFSEVAYEDHPSILRPKLAKY